MLLMKFFLTMPTHLRPYYEEEIQPATAALADKKHQVCWNHLERAHILGQPYPIEPTAVHWRMLIFGIRIKDMREILGQIPRLLIGGVKSFIGKITSGNTGRSNVPPLKPMIIPDDLQEMINTHNQPGS